MLKLKNLTRFSLVALFVMVAMSAPLKARAQDDDSDEPTIMPQSSSSSGAPPVIIDESDSGSVSDVQEYDE